MCCPAQWSSVGCRVGTKWSLRSAVLGLSFCLFVMVVFGIEPRALYKIVNHSSTELSQGGTTVSSASQLIQQAVQAP